MGNEYKNIANVLIFKFSGILVTIWLLFFIAYMYIACMCFSVTLNSVIQGEMLQKEIRQK